VNTSNAGDDFNAEEELKRSKQEREAHHGGANLRDEGIDLTDKDNRQMIRGENLESEHHKRRGGMADRAGLRTSPTSHGRSTCRAERVRDERVLEALRHVQREAFVEEGFEEFAYEDSPLPIGSGQTISQPFSSEEWPKRPRSKRPTASWK
jgi:hypothetical protein